MRNFFIKFAAIVAIGVNAVFSSCTNAPEKAAAITPVSAFSLDSVTVAIASGNKAFGEIFSTGDSTKFANYYTSDACINPGNMPKMCGSQAINDYFYGGYKMGIRNIRLTTQEVIGANEAVAETGSYEVFADKDQLIDKGKYIVIWKAENGKWKMHRDIWNTDMPPPPAKK